MINNPIVSFLKIILLCHYFQGDSGGPLFTDNHEIIGINDSQCPEDMSHGDRINLHLCIDIYRNFIADMIQ